MVRLEAVKNSPHPVDANEEEENGNVPRETAKGCFSCWCCCCPLRLAVFRKCRDCVEGGDVVVRAWQ